MNADAFLRDFYTKFRATPPQGESRLWTEGMRRILHAIGEGAGYVVCCEKFDREDKVVGLGEYLRLDFTYWQNRYEDIQEWRHDIWVPPDVVIEHENESQPFTKKLEDFFKACLYIARLRVFIGYAPRRDGSDSPRDEADQLVKFYDDHDFRQVDGAETFILLAYANDEPKDMEWEVRLLKGQASNWQRLTLPIE